MATTRFVGDAISFDKPAMRWLNGDLVADHLERARQSMNLTFPNYREAAFHARVAFEWRLKGFCKKHGVPVPYDPDGRELNTEAFLHAIEQVLEKGGTMPLAAVTIQRVKMFRRTVLNPLSHAFPITHGGGEVRAAVDAVASLRFQDRAAPGNPRSIADMASVLLATPTLSDAQRLEAACALRTAFEVDVRMMLQRLGGKVPYKLDPGVLTLAEIWDCAKDAMNATNATIAGPLVTDIEAKRLVFLDDWDYDHVFAFTQADLVAAWNALRDATTTTTPRTRLASFR